MTAKPFHNRYALLAYFIIGFLITSFALRTGLLLFSLHETQFTLWGIARLYIQGALYDLSVALLLSVTYQIYLLLMPDKWLNTIFNKTASYAWAILILLICFLSFFAEITFWQEFESRFNFIAVDYLIYTYEVINNINESYPILLLIGAILLLVIVALIILNKLHTFTAITQKGLSVQKRLAVSLCLLFLTIALPFAISNADAEIDQNRYEDELAKAGIFSFFAAYKHNEINYNDFYAKLNQNVAYKLVREDLASLESTFIVNGNSIDRNITSAQTPYKPNIIMITVESLSADFMARFGNTKNLTPVLDSLAKHNLVFDNMYATGTRTVRGMEALSLSIPPTPGSSIVRRANNNNLKTVGSIFKNEGYSRTFYYGGDGYFDNMNEYFGGNGFDITDKGKKVAIGDTYTTKRTIITDKEVSFQNAWGICDEDLYNVVIKGSDQSYQEGKPFYNFVMTTSNHRPYTFPNDKIKIPLGTREAAVKYTDFAIGEFLNNIKNKPWYKNTIVIIIADHCASSAGKNEIDVAKYHIPCLILNLPENKPKAISQMCSQIDLYPTLFGLLNWNYNSNLFGKDVNDVNFKPRAFLGTYQKLGYLSKDSLVILGPQQKVETFLYNKTDDEQTPESLNKETVNRAIAYYQTAYDLFKNGGLKQ